jgi:hypothetical protein
MKGGRWAEALLLGLAGKDETTYDRIKDEYFASQKDPFVAQVLKKIVDEDHESLIMESAHKNWKEALAYCLNYSSNKVQGMTEKLGDEL